MKILFLPGYACTSEIWLPLRAQLEAEHSTVAVDWPRLAISAYDKIQDFARWLTTESLDASRYDCIVGHSMGGLVALEWLASGAGAARHLVLVESFLLPPPPFFRNLLREEGTALAQAVHQMLEQERRHYSPGLQESLRLVDLTGCLSRLNGDVHALYGDRGCGSAKRVAAELDWPEAVSECVEVHVIRDACHFPMLENPQGTAAALRRILS
jgi:pimeloyl-ACP methyl ester carboxylesterase